MFTQKRSYVLLNERNREKLKNIEENYGELDICIYRQIKKELERKNMIRRV